MGVITSGVATAEGMDINYFTKLLFDILRFLDSEEKEILRKKLKFLLDNPYIPFCILFLILRKSVYLVIQNKR